MRRILPTAIVALIAVVVAAQPADRAPRHHFDASAFILADGSTEGGVVLSPSGGESRAVIPHYENNGVSFDDGESLVQGRMEDGVAVTTISVTMHNLNIRDVIHADKVVMRINERQRHADPEAEITFTGSRFVNLTISGQPVDLEVDNELFSRYPMYAAFAGAATRGERSFSAKADDAFASPRGPIVASLVTAIHASAASNDTTIPYAVHVDGLGTVYLGQVLVMPGRRHLSMIRVQPDGPGNANSGGNGRLRSNDTGTSTTGPAVTTPPCGANCTTAGTVDLATGDGNGVPIRG